MFQVQARVIYPAKDWWMTRGEDRPTFYVDNQATHQGAANVAVDILGLSKDKTVLINFAIMRMVSWYGIDIRPESQRSTPLDELSIPVLYFEYKRGKIISAGSSQEEAKVILIGTGIPIAVTGEKCEITLVPVSSADVPTYRIKVGEHEHEDWTDWVITQEPQGYWSLSRPTSKHVPIFPTPEDAARQLCSTGIAFLELKFV